MKDGDFESAVHDAAHRVTAGRAPEALRARVAAISAADSKDGGGWSRFGAGLHFAASAAAALALVAAGLLLVTRPNDEPVGPGSSGTAQVTASPVTTASPQPAAMIPHAFGSLSFMAPADWQIVLPKVWTAPVGPRVFLSNASISDPCPTEFSDACWRPLAALPPTGILVTIGGSATAQPFDATPEVIVDSVSEICRTLGGERQLHASFAGFWVTGCLRGPDLATNETAFRELVASITRD